MIRHLAKIPVVFLLAVTYLILKWMGLDTEAIKYILEGLLFLVIIFAIWDIRPHSRKQKKEKPEKKEKSE